MKNITIFGIVFSVIAIILWLFIPESPRYLYEKKKYEELRGTLMTIARVNKIHLKDDNFFKYENKETMVNQKGTHYSLSFIYGYIIIRIGKTKSTGKEVSEEPLKGI